MSADACCSAPGGDGLILLALILIGGFVYWWTSRWITGEAKAVSGHTIELVKTGKHVRLHALYSLQPPYGDRPGQPWKDAAGTEHDGGVIAKGMLAERLAGRKVKVRIGLQEKGDPFGREVGQVFVDCEDIGLSMVVGGYAFADKVDDDRDPSRLKRYRKAEAKAKRKRLGFHAGESEDPRAWIKSKIEKNFEGYHGDPEGLAKRNPDKFLELAEKIANEIGEELLVEWAMEFVFLV